MSIMDALERAKRLRQTHQRAQDLQEPASIHAPAAVGRAEPIVERRARAERPPQHYEPLRVVDISAHACEQNRVLLTDEQLRAFPQASAAYRLLRSKLQQGVKRNGWFSLGVSSPTPDDGKTTTILNVALSIAREKQRTVCVIDLDMRNPSIFKYFGLPDVRSIAEYLQGDAKAEDVIVQTSVPNLVVAGTLNAVDGASEMLAGPRFEQLLEYIRDRWPDSIVLLDLPPVNVTDEALVVAPRVDAMLLVVSEGKTQRSDLERALGVLSDYRVAGVIINRSSDFHVAKYDNYSM
jgi:protein-tyrosine kinase